MSAPQNRATLDSVPASTVKNRYGFLLIAREPRQQGGTEIHDFKSKGSKHV